MVNNDNGYTSIFRRDADVKYADVVSSSERI